MLSADGLIILQASNCNNQIPAKLYEYLRAQKPILALTDPEGDTGLKLISLGFDTISRLDSKPDIKELILKFLDSIRNKIAQPLPLNQLQLHSRESRTAELVEILNGIVR